MEQKEIKITPPEGYEIDREKSTLECIKFKKKELKSWRFSKESYIKDGYYIELNSSLTHINHDYKNIPENANIFATKELAESALAMAQISQVLANDERFGGPITDKEWYDKAKQKYVIGRYKNSIVYETYSSYYYFLAFHTHEQRDLFLKENRDLVKKYLMIG